MLNTVLGSLSSGVAASTSSYESIATVTAAGGETSLTFSSIPSTYKHLQIRGIARSTTSTSSAAIRLNSDTSTNYAAHWLYGDGASASASGSANRSNIWVQAYYPGSAYSSSMYGATIVDIHDYASSTKNKTIRTFNGLSTNSASDNLVNLVSGVWLNTNAITSVEFYFNGETIAAGTTFALYGIKG